jgi:hypothetical protein
MIPYLLRHEAVMGEIVRMDATNRELTPGGQMRTFPLITLATTEVCSMPIGKELWWSQDASGASWRLRELVPPSKRGGKWHLTLRRSAFVTAGSALPAMGDSATFSILHIKAIPPNFPRETDVPWTHRPAVTLGTGLGSQPIDMVASRDEPEATDPVPNGVDVSHAIELREDD